MASVRIPSYLFGPRRQLILRQMPCSSPLHVASACAQKNSKDAKSNVIICASNLGLIFGRSGSGKMLLLQLIVGLSKPTSGSICIQRYSYDGHPNQSPELLHPGRVGIVFQFLES